MLTRPEITEEVLAQIRQTIKENPDWGRKRISIHLCELWDWRIPGASLKDIACRSMLNSLEKAGKIVLPPPKTSSYQVGKKVKVKHLEHNTDPVGCSLAELMPIRLEAVPAAAMAEFKSYLDQYHYLGFDRVTGENMKYMAWSKSGAPLACLLFGAAAWACGDRDRFIGWNKEQRMANLMYLSNNVRFLIPEWVRVRNLASHVLGLVSRRINGDWEQKYGHGLLALETFVDGRFHGTSYKAANWIRVGRTLGRGRNDRKHASALPEKDIYLLPLSRRWKKSLLAGQPQEGNGHDA